MNLRRYLTPEVIAGGSLAAALAALALAARDAEAKPDRPADTEPADWRPPPGQLEGMGVTVRTLNHTTILDGKPFDGPALARWCEANGVRWLELQACWIDSEGRTKRYLPAEPTRAVVKELEAAGVKVGIWGWPDPINDQLYIDRMTEALDLTRAGWMKHDPEGPYHGAGFYVGSGTDRRRIVRPAAARRESAERIMAWSTSLAPTDVTSYGSGPKSHPSFPWAIWAAGARYGRPQWYDKKSDWSSAKVSSFAAQWRSLFPTLCPILSAVDTNTPDQMLSEAARFLPVADGPAFSYWDFYWLSRSKARTAAARMNSARYGKATA